jgi:cytochrome c-type biogenesis protein CcmH
MRRGVMLVFAGLLLAAPAHAVLPDEQLSDPKLEARARHISQELRCVVCQNQTIDDSDAPLAHDLRVLLRERLEKGDSDEAAEAFIVRRYGTYVLLKPPFQFDTLPLWLGPLLVLIAGVAASMFYFRGRNVIARAAPAQLNADEEAAVHRILGNGEA